jgi:predicted ATPase
MLPSSGESPGTNGKDMTANQSCLSHKKPDVTEHVNQVNQCPTAGDFVFVATPRGPSEAD